MVNKAVIVSGQKAPIPLVLFMDLEVKVSLSYNYGALFLQRGSEHHELCAGKLALTLIC